MPVFRAALLVLPALLAPLALRSAGAQEPAAPAAPPGQPSGRLETVLPRRCGVCHLDKAPPAASGLLAFTPPGREVGAGDAGMCYSCHNGIVIDGRRFLGGRHHPASGRVSCGSCHTPHVREANVGQFMRFPQGSYAFCGSCHTGRRTGGPGGHPIAVGEKGQTLECDSCHMVHRATGPGLVREGFAEALCRSCHGNNPSKAGQGPGLTTHPIDKGGPACLGCHGVHKTVGGKALLDQAAWDGRLCRQCHGSEFSMVKSEPNHPVGLNQTTCISCHRMHNAEKPGKRRGLFATAWLEADTVCNRCHAGLTSSGAGGAWNHPLGRNAAADERSLGGRLTRTGAFFAPGGKVICLSCHRSHGGRSGTPQLVTTREALCLYCHPNQNSLDPEQAALGAHPVLVRPRRASIAAAFLKAGGVTGAGGELLCTTCHRAHQGRPGTPGLVIPRESYSCLLCHSSEATISSSAHSSARVPGTVPERGRAGLCGSCHGEHGWRIPMGGPAKGQTAIETLCTTCHGALGGDPHGGTTNHPLGISPKPGSGSSGLPLFWSDGRRFRQGVISCATCHDPHKAGAQGLFLREDGMGGSPGLCSGCHAAQNVVVGTKHDLTAGPGRACSFCHAVHDPQATATWPTARHGGEGTNARMAGFCGGCHRAGGSAAKSVVVERSHPTAVPGDQANKKSVGCVACHNPHRWNPDDPADRGKSAAGDARTKFLVRSAAGSAELCAQCHGAEAVVVGTRHDLTKLAEQGLPPGVPDPKRKGICGVCHSIHGRQPLPAMPSKPGKPAAGSDPCEFCHAAGKLAAKATVGEHGHPIGVSPGQDVGADLPLYGYGGRRQPAGRIACATCHDPHRWEPPGGSGGGSKAATSFLRFGADGYAPLCFPCHADKSMVVGTDHDLRVTAPRAVNLAGENAELSGVCGACHAVHRASPGPVLWNRTFGEGWDERSRACTACHHPGNDQGAHVPPRLEAHLMNYPGRGLVRRIFTITRVFTTTGQSILPIYPENESRPDRGYLSCTSCHDVHRWEKDVSSSGAGVPVEGDLRNSFLRVRVTDLERTVCAECHADSLPEHLKNYHFPVNEKP